MVWDLAPITTIPSRCNTKIAMFSNYIKIALRNLRRYRFYSLLNISGLTVGLSCCLFIFLYVKDESSFDAYHANIDRIYRLNFFAKLGDQLAHFATSPKPAGLAFKEGAPEIEAFCRLQQRGNETVRYDNQVFLEANTLLADSTLFKVFSFKLLEGNPQKALAAPHSVVLSQTTAKKYFGNDSPMGQYLKMGDQLCQITGVMADIPQNTHFKADIIRSMSSIPDNAEDSWGSTNTYNYFLLREGTDLKRVSEKITAIFVQNFTPILMEAFNTTWEEYEKGGNYARVELFPVRDIHLYGDLDDELGTNGDVKYVYIFGIIGLFILTLACINFMNLATARAAIRAKEVGVRKAVGAFRSDLTKQFLSESILMALVAMVLSLGTVWLLLPYFNHLSNKVLTVSAFLNPGFLLMAVALAGLIGVAAGSYPAFVLSAFKPEKVLKGSGAGALVSNSGSGHLRSGLVVFQFFTTAVLLIGSLVVYQQLAFIKDKKLGFKKENVLVLNNAYLLGNQLETFKEKMLQNTVVQHASICNSLPAISITNASVAYKGRTVTQENSILINNWWADHDYLKTMQMDIAAGRDFSKAMASDSTAVIVNETLAKSFGYPQKSVIGEEISLNEDRSYQIVGVVKDFNFSSLRNHVEPLAIYQGGYISYLAIRFETDKVDALVKNLRSTWEEMAPGKPFDYVFLDQRFNNLYTSESRTEKVVGVFAFLAIFIACLGLFGLATFMTEQRRKEIGVRKVLGASVAGITGLLAKDFLKLVLLSVLLATPLAWYGMNQWLANFAYRIEIHWTVFLLVGAAAMTIAFLTVGFQSVKAALVNPVRSLRSE